MFKYTRHTLEKLEELFREAGYVIRYEKGTFQSGHCIVESRKIVVINKFFETEGRINTLVDILGLIDIDQNSLSEKSARFFVELQKSKQPEEIPEDFSPS